MNVKCTEDIQYPCCKRFQGATAARPTDIPVQAVLSPLYCTKKGTDVLIVGIVRVLF